FDWSDRAAPAAEASDGLRSPRRRAPRAHCRSGDRPALRSRLDHTHSCRRGGNRGRIGVEPFQGSQQDQGRRGPYQLGMATEDGDASRLDAALTPSIIPDVVEQHAEEAAFLWNLRDAATEEPHYALRHLAALEERIEAHID